MNAAMLQTRVDVASVVWCKATSGSRPNLEYAVARTERVSEPPPRGSSPSTPNGAASPSRGRWGDTVMEGSTGWTAAAASVFKARHSRLYRHVAFPSRAGLQCSQAVADEDAPACARLGSIGRRTRLFRAARQDRRCLRNSFLEPVYIPSYALLFQAIEAEPTLTAWAPPLVASDLLSAASAVPIATASRRGTTTYYSALVVDRGSPIERPE